MSRSSDADGIWFLALRLEIRPWSGVNGQFR